MIEGYNTGHDRFTYKGYGRIYVRTPTDIQVVEGILRELDQNEFDNYYAPDLVTTLEEYPRCVYTGKYEQSLKELKQVCAKRNVPIFCLDAGKNPETPGYQVTLDQTHIQLLWFEEPEIGKPKTLWEVMYEEKWCRSGCDEFCRIVEKWMAQFSSEGGDFSILTENIK